jgi:uncharacterized membrane protein
MSEIKVVKPAAAATVTDRFAQAVERWVQFVAKHWLAALNVLFLVYVGLPFLGPVFMQAGATLPARIIYTIYVPLCHQLPERSYFLFGESRVYSLDELPLEVADAGPLQRRSYIGDEAHGYKMAMCERDLAIYGSMFIMGLIFALRNHRLPLLPLKGYLLFVLPMAIDGVTQLVGLRTSNWWLRTVTGALFGVGTVWFVYPYLARVIAEIRLSSSGNDKVA